MMRSATLPYLILGLLCSLTLHSRAQTFPCVGDLAWGATVDEVVAKGNLGNTNLVMLKVADLVPGEWNGQHVALATEFMLAPPAKAVIFTGPGNERIDYYLCDNRLGLVVHMAKNSRAFSPDRLLAGIDATFGNATDRRERVDVELPHNWGQFDRTTEYCLTIDWESTTGLARAFCRTWPINDKRQIYRAYYLSKTQLEKNKQRMKQVKIEEAQRKAELAKKAEEEAARKKAAAEAAKAEKAAKAAAAKQL
ncbi:MAG: hypothetical protein ACI9TH_003587 [Kiritimatiellia bacterium]|jgi:hypothetical protein